MFLPVILARHEKRRDLRGRQRHSSS